MYGTFTKELASFLFRPRFLDISTNPSNIKSESNKARALIGEQISKIAALALLGVVKTVVDYNLNIPLSDEIDFTMGLVVLSTAIDLALIFGKIALAN